MVDLLVYVSSFLSPSPSPHSQISPPCPFHLLTGNPVGFLNGFEEKIERMEEGSLNGKGPEKSGLKWKV